ncbi:TPA: helix-turn-helix transcriptional regulator [Candidatus Scatousia excrementigallinarum]|uniref:Helix-turn-helix transcriptional regulator n=1 Tax=Candidatus Scatousia excrementigallinarum TaxID=2840935 RepID=A0A9D1JNI4_9BACT|nr:helix-turn-helix transcriptional regulator [Candidatus Scatousia excrementigallinarum]
MRNEKILKAIGNNLRAERNRLGWSQDELAEKACLERQHISKIERGLIDMRVSATLVPILKALNLEFEKLYKFD